MLKRKMGAIELGFRCSENGNGISDDPQPDWTFDSLLLELDSMDKKQNLVLDFPTPFTTRCSDSDDDTTLVSVSLYHLMDRTILAEVAVIELAHDLKLIASEEVRSILSYLETELVNEHERFASSTTKIQQNRKLQQERDRKFDLQYRRTVASALDNHLTVVQRDHEHMSQIEERRIRDDLAREEAKRKEKTIMEEKLRQERIKAEEEARQKAEMTERAKAAEAERKAASKCASDNLKPAVENSKGTLGLSSLNDVEKGNLIKASKNALELENRRRQVYEELTAKNYSNQDYRKHGFNIFMKIKTISASVENVKIRTEELVKLINNSPGCPQFISVRLFAEKILSNCKSPKSSKVVYATSRVIVLVTSKIPMAMDILIAELNRVCIYTVPKHISYSKEVFNTEDAYYKAIGYNEEDGKLEGMDAYVERLSCYMKLYGALVQTQVQGFKNLHGLEEGWAWLARFLNALPANLYTAVALDSFLEMAGYTLYRAYKNQFVKLLIIIERDFLNALKEDGSESQRNKVKNVKSSIQNYIESKQFMNEPEGLHLISHLESNDFYVHP